LFPFLAADFTAQDVGLQRSVQVTSTFGLRTGELVRIGEGVYRLVEINSSREIVISNEGAGYQVGQTISALDSVGDYQYLITEENTSACSATTVYEGKITTCVGSDEKILRGELTAQVPVLQDATLGTARYKFLDSSVRTCTKLTAQAIITTGTTTYTITVASAAAFLANDYVVFMTDTSGMRFRVSSIAGNSVTIIRTVDSPAANYTAPIDTIFCKEESTVTLRKDLITLQGQVGAVASVPTGVVNPYVGSTAPSGWLFAHGGTIGNASSGASIRANADTQPLFEMLWNSMADAQAPVIGGRGASAAADYAANKRITLPDLQQRFIIGLSLSGTGSTHGGIGGTIDHTHSVPAHFHGLGTGADLSIASSGTHTTTIDIGHNHTATAAGAGVLTSNFSTTGVSLTQSPHSHGGATTLFNATHTHTIQATGTTGAGTHVHDTDGTSGNRLATAPEGSATDEAGYATLTPSISLNHGHGINADNAILTWTEPNGGLGHQHTIPDHGHTITVVAFSGTRSDFAGAGAHVHTTANFSGRVGLVTGGVDGNAAMVTGATNPPFIALRHIIKL
jgi:hypothetical protein